MPGEAPGPESQGHTAWGSCGPCGLRAHVCREGALSPRAPSPGLIPRPETLLGRGVPSSVLLPLCLCDPLSVLRVSAHLVWFDFNLNAQPPCCVHSPFQKDPLSRHLARSTSSLPGPCLVTGRVFTTPPPAAGQTLDAVAWGVWWMKPHVSSKSCLFIVQAPSMAKHPPVLWPLPPYK